MSSLDYLDLCRLCLVKDRVSVPIFEDEGDVRQIFLKITACLPVKVSREDKLPKKICDDCVYKVELFYQFWNTTANAEKQLLQWLGEVGGLEDNQSYVTEVLNSNVMKQERSSDSRLDGSVMQVGGHQNNMDIGMIDNMSLITMPTGNEQFTSVPMDTANAVQTVQAVAGSSTQTSHDQITQNQTAVTHLVEEEEESEDEENSDDGCDNEEGLPVKEETEEDPSEQPLEPTTFVNVSIPCDEAGPSGLQQQKISEISELTLPQTADGDSKTGSSSGHQNMATVTYAEDLPMLVSSGNNSYRVRRKPSWLKDSVTDFDSLRDICPFCDKHFKDDRRVAMHVRNVHKKPYKCDLCRRQYFNQEVLERHRKTHNTDSHFECKVCHLKYKREETLQCHYVRVHSNIEANLRCDHCGKRYKLKQDLMLHINQVHMCSYQICRFCGKAVKNVKAHEWHHQKKLDISKNEQVFPCGLCFKKFRSETKLENHLMRHVQRYRCQECDETFPGPGQLMNHKSKHRPGISCIICQKCFTSRSNYYQHVLMHAKVRPYKCDICREDFTQRSTLVRHRKTHPGPLPNSLAQVPIADLARKVLKSFKNFT